MAKKSFPIICETVFRKKKILNAECCDFIIFVCKCLLEYNIKRKLIDKLTKGNITLNKFFRRGSISNTSTQHNFYLIVFPSCSELAAEREA